MLFGAFPRKTRCLLWTILIGAFLTVFSLVFALVILPAIIKTLIGDQLILKNGTEAWDRFMELPFPMDFKLYFFNVTNSEDVKNGAQPYVEEIGPFTYLNYRKKENVKRIDDEHLSYNTRQTFEFDEERSIYSEDYELYTLNFVVIGLLQILENAIIDFDYSIEELLPYILDETDLFYRVKVKNFIFNGTPFCNPKTKHLLAKCICMVVMLLNLKMIEIHDDLSMTYSLLGWKQNYYDGTFVVNTGEKDLMKLGDIQSWNDMQYTNIWMGEESDCNKIDGYDIAVFAPYIEKADIFKIYSTDICRTMSMTFQEKTNFRDIEVYKFGFGPDTWRPLNNCTPDESCFCSDYTRGMDGEKSCFMDGVQDVYPCLGIPALISFPHFLYADNKYLDGVDNLHPNPDIHASYLKFQPLAAAPLEGWINLQMSLILRPIKLRGKMVKVTERLANLTLPTLWLQQGVTITDELYDTVNFSLTLLGVAEIAKWVFVLISGLILIFPIAKLLVGTT